jgi:two-component system phosphate regulon sensor histidine kinase PhoR
VGIVFTQLYWIKSSLQLKQEQFDNRVRIGVKGVLNRLSELENKEPAIGTHARDIRQIIPTAMLDSLFYDDLGCMNLDIANNYYGIYRRSDSSFVAGHYQLHQKQLIESSFQFSLKGIYRNGDYYLSLYFPDKDKNLFGEMEIWLLISILFLLVIVASFVFTISALLKQKKLSEMKNEFINNLTHELKTPLATATLAAEIMLRDEVNHQPERVKKYASVIMDENIRLKNMVEQVLQMAALEKGYQRFQLRKEDVHELLKSVIDGFELRLQETGSKLDFYPKANRSTIKVDAQHMVNVFYNLLDNAIKYSDGPAAIIVSTKSNKTGIFICFSDKGKGIKREYQHEIFRNFYRVPTGNIQDNRGFGMGLHYVKKVMEAHGGRVSVKSNEGKGSVFELFIPFRENISL